MSKVLIIAEVEDIVRWEEGFRTHGDLFRNQSVKSPIEFATNDDNTVGILAEPDDLDQYLSSMNDQATAEAMANDGVKRETVKLFILNKSVSF